MTNDEWNTRITQCYGNARERHSLSGSGVVVYMIGHLREM